MFCGPRAHSGGPQALPSRASRCAPSVFERLAGGEERVAAVIGHDTRLSVRSALVKPSGCGEVVDDVVLGLVPGPLVVM